jgi:hypothetical protein
MKLPHGNRPIVDDAKVQDYLLSPDHPIGRFKARVFGAVGYQRSDWQRLRDDLTTLAAVGDAELNHADAFGQRWVTRGELPSPSGRLLRVVAVWLIPSEGAVPRLITAYPASSG